MKMEQTKIDIYNTEQKQKKFWGRKYKLISAWFFFYKKLLQDNKKSGLDFAWYTFEIYIKQFFFIIKNYKL